MRWCLRNDDFQINEMYISQIVRKVRERRVEEVCMMRASACLRWRLLVSRGGEKGRAHDYTRAYIYRININMCGYTRNQAEAVLRAKIRNG